MSYAARGWLIVPLHGVVGGGCTCREGHGCKSPGKHPRLLSWQTEASADEQRIAEWLHDYPVMNIGVQMGPRSGIVDLETDNVQGENTLRLMFGGDIPPTPSFTSGKGTHRLFKYDPQLPDKGNIPLAGMDIKIGAGHLGSQSVFPPSEHVRGVVYRWVITPEDCSLATLSARALAWINNGVDPQGDQPRGKSQDDWRRIVAGTAEGGRNNNLTSLAGAVLRNAQDISSEVQLGVMLQMLKIANLNNTPPLDEDEVLSLFKSVLKSEQRRRASESAGTVLTQPIEQRIEHARTSGVVVPEDMKLVRVNADPVYYEFHSKWFTQAHNGCLILAPGELTRFDRLRTAAVEQANYAIPLGFGKLWSKTGGIFEQLLHSAESRNASLGESRIGQLAEFILEKLSGAKRFATMEDFNQVSSGVVLIEDEGVYLVKLQALRKEIKFESLAQGDLQQRLFNQVGITDDDYRRSPKKIKPRARLLVIRPNHVDSLRKLARAVDRRDPE